SGRVRVAGSLWSKGRSACQSLLNRASVASSALADLSQASAWLRTSAGSGDLSAPKEESSFGGFFPASAGAAPPPYRSSATAAAGSQGVNRTAVLPLSR